MRHFFKTFYLISGLFFLSVAVRAQDKIYKKDGTEIDAKVKTVGEKAVIYKRSDNLDGPDYSIWESEIARIVYPNGKMDLFNNFDKEPVDNKGSHKGKDKEEQKYGKNIFSVMPIAYTAAVDGTINDAGIGICYERLLDKHGRIGFNLPVMMSFSSSKDYENNTINVNGTNLNYGHYTSVYFMPGVKFYPAPDRVKVRYSIGVSFFAILGGEPAAVYDANNATGNYNPSTGAVTYSTGTYHYAMYGLMLSNSLNIAATKHLYMALDLDAGLPVSDNRFADGNDLGIPVPFIQIGFKVGYRYGS